MKKIYTITGLPRAGNTLLASLLNQHPEVQATGHSPTPDLFYQLNKVKNGDVYLNIPDEKSYDNVMKNIIRNYYSDWDSNYIIERGDWITPFNFELFRKYAPNEIKIVILVRDVLDVLKSFIEVSQKYPDFFLNRQYADIDKTTLLTDDIIEVLCDLLMTGNGYVNTSLYSIKWFLDNKLDKEYDITFIEYEDLVNNTQDTLQEINSFYGLPKFVYRLTELNQFNVNGTSYNDETLGAPLHMIHTTEIKPRHNSVVLPERVVAKYSGLEWWKNN